MIRTIAWYSNFVLTLAAATPKLYKVRLLDKAGKHREKTEYVHKTTSKWASSQVKMSGARINIHGLENIPEDIPVVFISNHQSNFDIALFMSCIDKPKGYISKHEMGKVPLLRSWMRAMNCVFMDRSSLRKSAEAIAEGVKILKGGHSLVIFPEGTRSKGDTMGEFKAGSIKLATKAGVPIVPVTIKGSYKLMESNNSMIKPADVELFIHPMIETANLSKEEQDLLNDKLVEIIKSKL
ncbi:MAG: lysophospholipid acyltransferase family protein [Bacillota bacterium]